MAIVNLRGRTELGTTILTVLERYAQNLRDADCRLMLTGVSEHILDEFETTGIIKTFGRKNVFKATDRAGESMLEALSAAEAWLEEAEPEPVAEDEEGEQEVVE